MNDVLREHYWSVSEVTDHPQTKSLVYARCAFGLWTLVSFTGLDASSKWWALEGSSNGYYPLGEAEHSNKNTAPWASGCRESDVFKQNCPTTRRKPGSGRCYF